MAQLVIEAMERHGTKFLFNTVPTKIEKEKNKRIRVTYETLNVGTFTEVYDTVLLAIGS